MHLDCTCINKYHSAYTNRIHGRDERSIILKAARSLVRPKDRKRIRLDVTHRSDMHAAYVDNEYFAGYIIAAQVKEA